MDDAGADANAGWVCLVVDGVPENLVPCWSGQTVRASLVRACGTGPRRLLRAKPFDKLQGG